MRALVTGGAGFIGSNLVDALLARGDDVTVVDDLSTGSRDNIRDAEAVGAARPGAFTFLERDLTDGALGEVVAAGRPEVIFHLAAQMDVRVSVRSPLRDAVTNVVGTVAVLEAAAHGDVRKVVFTSSGGTIYGSPAEQPVRETSRLDPLSPYAAAKAAAEHYIHAYRGLYGLDTTVLALGNVYGPRQAPHGEAGVVAIFARLLLEGKPTVIFGDGSSVRDYVHIDDVVAALLHFAGPAAPGAAADRVNVGTAVGTSVRELHTRIAAAVGVPDEVGFADPRAGELPKIILDVSLAGTLGWRPTIGLAEGLPGTVGWVRSQLAR